jgi:hypothetical protein
LVARDSVLSQVRGVKDISIPLGNVQGLPTVIFRCGEITTEKRRLGLLKLGILPRYVFRDVVIEVTGRGEPHQWRKDLSAFASSEPFFRQARIDRISFRHLVTKVEIEAEQAEFFSSMSGKVIHMRDVVHRQGDTQIAKLPEAAVPLSGPESGAKELTVAERMTNNMQLKALPIISFQ